MSVYALVVEDLQEGYVDVCQEVLECGEIESPRGMQTLELLDQTIVVMNPHRTLPIGVGRGLNVKFAAREALQVIGGYSDPNQLVEVVPRMQQFMDGGVFHGAYGPRVGPQFEHVLNVLVRDPSSRQAVMNIYDATCDLDRPTNDVPCTLTLTFRIRQGKLELKVHMRSNDVWWGLGYDAFVFSNLQCTMARCLGVEAGRYIHHADSLHAYERDWESIKGLHVRTPELASVVWTNGLASPDEARRIGIGHAPPLADDTSSLWFYEHADLHA
jgi:thymidylate synthase